MRAIYLVCLLGIALNVQSQSKDSISKVTVHPSLSIGIAEGKSFSAILLNIGLGVRYKTYQAGVGVGIDEYFLRTIPLYFDVRKDLLSEKSTPFAYGSLGTNLPWTNAQQSITYTGRLFYELGIGYRLPLGYKSGVFFTAGYSYKELSSEQTYPVYCITWPCPEQRQYFQYQLRRLSLKAGVNF